MNLWGLCRLPAGRLKQTCVAACSARMLHDKKPADSAGEEDLSKPLKFSSSKASHRTWTVLKSLGSEHQRPWWKVLPVSLTIMAILAWAAFRKETEIDEILYRPISQLLEELEKSSSGAETEKSSSGAETEKSSSGAETEKSSSGAETEKSSSGAETEKSSSGAETEKSSSGAETEKSSSGAETEKGK